MLGQVRQLTLAALLLAACTKDAKPVAAAPAVATSDAGAQRHEAAESTAELTAAPPTVTFRARAGYHVNREYPVAFTPDGAARVSLKDALVLTPCEGHPEESGAAQASLPGAQPDASGRVGGVLAFSVCREDRCLIEKVTLAATAAR